MVTAEWTGTWAAQSDADQDRAGRKPGWAETSKNSTPPKSLRRLLPRPCFHRLLTMMAASASAGSPATPSTWVDDCRQVGLKIVLLRRRLGSMLLHRRNSYQTVIFEYRKKTIS
eukprot:GHVU01013432.1.p1 GENE.GHVU01013432.1~~GHVU01013432.1.p1  ORF type:complete len:114 (-),score=3.58 GHVU01013432.1:55-396(-)